MSNDKGSAGEDWLSAPVGTKSSDRAPEHGSASSAPASSSSSAADPEPTVVEQQQSGLSRYKSSFTNRIATEPETGSLYPAGSGAGPSTGASPALDAEPSPGPATSVGLGSNSTSTGIRTVSARQRRGGGRGPRRAKLQIRHIDPWSTLKLSLVLAVAFFFVWMIAVAILYGVLSGMGVFESIDSMFTDLGGKTTTIVTPKLIFGGAALIGAINIVLFTALATIGAYIYNLCADLAGGLEITLAERG